MFTRQLSTNQVVTPVTSVSARRPSRKGTITTQKNFNHEKYATNTELSKLIWELKDSREEYNISWEIAASASALRSGKGRCDLCCTEKLLIIMAAPGSIINKRDEMVSKCRHRNKFTLKGFR